MYERAVQQVRTDRRTASLALCALAALLIAAATHAETIAIDDQVSVVPSSVQRPSPGMSMQAVEAKYGAPQTRHEAVGTPPITRWDYAEFSVFFEKDRVIDAVVTPGAAPTSADAASPANNQASGAPPQP